MELPIVIAREKARKLNVLFPQIKTNASKEVAQCAPKRNMRVKIFTPPHGKYKFENVDIVDETKAAELTRLGCIATAEPLSSGVWSIAIEYSQIGDYKIKLCKPEDATKTLEEIIGEIDIEKLISWIESDGNEE